MEIEVKGRTPQTDGSIRWLWGILLVSLALKLGLAWVTRDALSYFDESEYYEKAVLLASGRGVDEVFRPPGYLFFLAALFRIPGNGLLYAKAAQALLGTLSAYLLFLIARALFDRRTGLVACALFAFYPTLVAYAHYLWPETLYIFCVLATLYLLIGRGAAPRSRACFLGGLAAGVTALTRSVFLGFLPFLALYAFLRNRPAWRGVRCAALFFGGLALVLAPWAWRNYRLTDRFLLVATEAGQQAWHCHNALPCYGWDYGVQHVFREEGWYHPDDDIFGHRPPPASRKNREFHHEVKGGEWAGEGKMNPVDAFNLEMENALTFIRKHPLLALKRMGPKASCLWSPNSLLIRHLRLGLYEKTFATDPPLSTGLKPGPRVVRGMAYLAVLSYVLVMVTGIMGICFAEYADPSRILVLLFVLFFGLLHSFNLGMSRYRLPLMPIVMVFSAYAITHPRSILARKGHRLRWVPACLLLMILFLFVVQHITATLG